MRTPGTASGDVGSSGPFHDRKGTSLRVCGTKFKSVNLPHAPSIPLLHLPARQQTSSYETVSGFKIQQSPGNKNTLHKGDGGRIGLREVVSGGHNGVEVKRLLERREKPPGQDAYNFLELDVAGFGAGKVSNEFGNLQPATRDNVISGETTRQKQVSRENEICGYDFMEVGDDEIATEWEEGGEEGGEEVEGWEAGEEREEGDIDWDEVSSDDELSPCTQVLNLDAHGDMENCDYAEKRKRVSQGDSQHLENFTKKAKKGNKRKEDGKGSREDKGGQEGKEKQSIKTRVRKSASNQSRLYVCPYFQNSPREHPGCAGWNNVDTHRVKEHCKRVHLKPLQCRNCGLFRAGDHGQMKEHSMVGCERATTIVDIDLDIIRKGGYLDRRGLSWEQIYEILFPNSPDDIPPQCREELEVVTPIVDDRLLSPQVRPSLDNEGQLLAHFTKFLREHLHFLSPEVLPNLLRQYLDNRTPQPRDGPLPIILRDEELSIERKGNMTPHPSTRTQASDVLRPNKSHDVIHANFSHPQIRTSSPSANRNPQTGFENTEYQDLLGNDRDTSPKPYWDMLVELGDL